MNIQQLEYLIALDKHKSFSKAAASCYITQATLSTMIKKLEEELEVVLFDRKTNPILTTVDGDKIIEEAKKVILHLGNMKHVASTINNRIEGTLTLGIIPTIAGSLLPKILAGIMEKYPHLHLRIVEITTESVIQQLKSGGIDAGIISTPVEKKEIEEDVLYYEKLMVYGSHESNRKYVLPQEMAKNKIWLLEEGHCLRDQFINLCSLNPKRLKHNLNFQPTSFESLIALVDTMGGLTLIPELYYNDLPEEKKCRVKNFKAPYPVREVSLVYYRPYVKHKLIRLMHQEIKDIINPLLESRKLKNSELMIAKI